MCSGKVQSRANFKDAGAAIALAVGLVVPAYPGKAPTPQQQAWRILAAGVREKSIEKRVQAVQALGLAQRSGRAEKMAAQALKDVHPEVRAAAATALGEMGASAAIPDLKNALEDKDPSVVLAAAHSLVALKDNKGYEVYYAVLTGKRKSGRGLVAEERRLFQDPRRLAEFGAETGLGFIPFAGLGVTAVKKLAKDEASPVRAAAARFLTRDPDSRSVDALVEAASGDRSAMVRQAALEALARRDDPKLLPKIVPSLDDPKDSVRYTASAAIIRLSNLSGRRRAFPFKPPSGP
jgi:HEAT repeat protein